MMAMRNVRLNIRMIQSFVRWAQHSKQVALDDIDHAELEKLVEEFVLKVYEGE